MAMGFMIWQVLSMDGTAIFGNGTGDWVTGVSVLGSLVWFAALLNLLWILRPSALDPETCAVLNDELVQANRAIAIRNSYIATALGAVSLYVLTLFVEADGATVARIMLAITVTSPMLSFAVAEEQHG